MPSRWSLVHLSVPLIRLACSALGGLFFNFPLNGILEKIEKSMGRNPRIFLLKDSTRVNERLHLSSPLAGV